jgi:hypothetical protein
MIIFSMSSVQVDDYFESVLDADSFEDNDKYLVSFFFSF